MDAFELYNSKGEPCGVWCCGKCRKLTMEDWRPSSGPPKSTRESAEKCCQPWICETCGSPGTMYSPDECETCRSKRFAISRADRLAKLLAAAKDVTAEYEGPVCVEDYSGGDMGGDGFFSAAHIAAEYLADGEDAQPGERWAFACKPEVRQLDIADAIERLCEDGYEDMGDDLSPTKALLDAAAEFNQLYKSELTVWNVDHSRKIRIVVEAAA
jgi:hypothetical protein